MTAPSEIVARRLLKQAEWCERLGSSLYSIVLRHTAEDVRAAGVCCAVLHDHYDDPPDSALALRFLGAVHRLVLQGKAPQLAACYPSVGGDSNCNDLWPRFRGVVRYHEAVLRELVHRPVQTNEVGRCAALLGGFLEVARQTGLPLRLLEVGAAGGLILRWDHYRYEAGHEGWGNSHSPVRMTGVFGSEHPRFDISGRGRETSVARCGRRSPTRARPAAPCDAAAIAERLRAEQEWRPAPHGALLPARACVAASRASTRTSLPAAVPGSAAFSSILWSTPVKQSRGVV